MTPESIAQALKESIESALANCRVVVTIGSPGHYALDVRAPQFAGQSTLQRQRAVYSAIRELMAGDNAPVHAIDSMTTSAD